MSDKVEARLVPQLAPGGTRIRVLIDSDAAAEVDDQYGIALALLSPERLKIEGFVASHFRDRPDSRERAAEEIQRVMSLAGMPGAFPVRLGAHPMQYETVPAESEGVDLIIERAMAGPGEDRLWIVGLGGCTNIASAWLKCPEIADRAVVLWHGRSQFWPERNANANFGRDPRAAIVLFRSTLPLVLFDTGTYLRMPMEESEVRLRPHGALGRYLHDIRLRDPWNASPEKGLFDLGDVAALVDPTLVYSEVVAAPGVSWNGMYEHWRAHGRMRRIYQIDRDRTFDLFLSRLRDRCASA